MIIIIIIIIQSYYKKYIFIVKSVINIKHISKKINFNFKK